MRPDDPGTRPTATKTQLAAVARSLAASSSCGQDDLADAGWLGLRDEAKQVDSADAVAQNVSAAQDRGTIAELSDAPWTRKPHKNEQIRDRITN